MQLGGRGRGRGRWQRGRAQQSHDTSSSELLRVKIALDEAKRGFVIGAQGAVVKQTQKDTRAQIRTPKRGDEGPTEISGPDAISVLHACCLVARQTSATCECTCSVAGSAELRATLQVTSTTAHRLFETAAGAAASFVAFCLPAARDSLQSAIAAIDDASFAAGTSTVQCFASIAGGELYLYGLGEGANAACKVYETLVTAPKRPRVEEAADACTTASASAHHGEWQAVLLSGSLASGGEDHGIIEAALRGKTGLGPAAKPLNMQAVGGELYLVDAALLEQLDVLLGMQKKVRFEGVVEEGAGRTSTAWIYRPREAHDIQ